MSSTLVFDIQTMPDIQGLRLLHELPAALSDYEVGEYALQRQRAHGGVDDLPPHLQRVLVISCVLRTEAQVRLFSFSAKDSDEADVLKQFFNLLSSHSPSLVGWNLASCTCPVLNFRSLIHGCAATQYFSSTRGHVSNLGRLLVEECARVPSLADVACLAGLPKVPVTDGWSAYLQAKETQTLEACEISVLTCYLLYLRWKNLSGEIDHAVYGHETALLRDSLQTCEESHILEYLAAWAG